MSEMKIAIEHEGKKYSGHIATIDSTNLQVEDHGIFTAMLHTSWKGGGVGVGGFCLDSPEKDEDGKHLGRIGTAYGADHIMRLIETVGAPSWEALQGKQVIVLFEGENAWGSVSVGIAGITNEKIFILKDHAAAWKEKVA